MFFRVLVFIFDLSQSGRNGKTIWKVYKLVASLEGYCSWTHVRPCVLANIELTIPLLFQGYVALIVVQCSLILGDFRIFPSSQMTVWLAMFSLCGNCCVLF